MRIRLIVSVIFESSGGERAKRFWMLACLSTRSVSLNTSLSSLHAYTHTSSPTYLPFGATSALETHTEDSKYYRNLIRVDWSEETVGYDCLQQAQHLRSWSFKHWIWMSVHCVEVVIGVFQCLLFPIISCKIAELKFFMTAIYIFSFSFIFLYSYVRLINLTYLHERHL